MEMTMREFFKAVVVANISEEMNAKATEEIAKLDKKNEKRSSKPSKVALANEPIKAKIVEYVTSKGRSIASEIAEGLDITTQKASALCRQLVEAGVLVSGETKIPKKGKVKFYALAGSEPTE